MTPRRPPHPGTAGSGRSTDAGVPRPPPPPPPVELEAERAVLGAWILEPALLAPYVDTLPREVFFKEASRLIWDALCTLHHAGQGIDAITLAAELRRRNLFEQAGGDTFLAILEEEGTVATQVEAYVHLLREAALRRDLLALGGYLTDGACNGQPVAALLAELRHFEPVGVEPGLAQGYIDPLPDFLAEPDPPSRFVFPDLLPADVMLLLHGEPRSRKSLTAVELALAAATGTAPFGLERFRPATPINVLYVQEEDSRALTRQRLRRLVTERMGSEGLLRTCFVSVRRGVNLDNPTWIARLTADIRRLEIKLLVLDAARRLSRKTDEGPTKVSELMASLRRLIHDTGIAIVIVHHDVKPPRDGQDQRRRSQRTSGGDWFAACECPVHVERISDTETLVFPEDYKFSPDPAPFTFHVVTDGGFVIALDGTDTTTQDAATAGDKGKLLAWLVANGPATRTQIKRAGFRWETVERLLEALMREGRVDAMPGARKDSLQYFAAGRDDSFSPSG